MFKKSLAEFAARRRQKIETIFSRDMRVRENTSQAASVEFLRTAHKLCAQQAVSLLSEKPSGFFRQFQAETPIREPPLFVTFYSCPNKPL